MKTKNQGLGLARIEGYKRISKNSSHFLVIDPDDSVIEGFNLLRYQEELNKYDIVSFSFINEWENTNKKSHINHELFGAHITKYYCFKNVTGFEVWGSFYRNKKFIINILSDPSPIFEDMIASSTLKYASKASIIDIKKPFINRLLRINALSSRKPTLLEQKIHLQQRKKLLDAFILPDKIQKQLIYDCRNSIHVNDKISRNDIYEIMKFKKFIFRYVKFKNIFIVLASIKNKIFRI